MASSHVYAGPAATALPATPKRGGGGCAMNDTQTDLNAPRGVATTFIENSTYDYAFLEGRMLTRTRNAPRLLSARCGSDWNSAIRSASYPSRPSCIRL